VKIYNPPSELPLQAYEQQVDLLVGRYMDLPGVVSVCTMGSVRAPGLSDIDFVIVIDDAFEKERAGELHHRAPDVDRRMVIHAPVVLHVSELPAAKYLLYMTNLQEVAGNIPVDLASLGQHSPLLDLCILLDFNEGRLCQYANTISSGSLDQRHWATIFWSLTHSCDLLGRMEIPLSDESNQTVQEIRDMRKGWLEHAEIVGGETFVDMFWRSRKVTCETFRSALAFRALLDAGSVNGGGARVFRGPYKDIHCSGDEIDHRATSLSLRGVKRTVSTVATYPQSYASHLAAYGFTPDHPVEVVNGELTAFQQERRRAVEQHDRLMKRFHLDFSNGPYLGLPVVHRPELRYRAASLAHRVFRHRRSS